MSLRERESVNSTCTSGVGLSNSVTRFYRLLIHKQNTPIKDIYVAQYQIHFLENKFNIFQIVSAILNRGKFTVKKFHFIVSEGLFVEQWWKEFLLCDELIAWKQLTADIFDSLKMDRNNEYLKYLAK